MGIRQTAMIVLVGWILWTHSLADSPRLKERWEPMGAFTEQEQCEANAVGTAGAFVDRLRAMGHIATLSGPSTIDARVDTLRVVTRYLCFPDGFDPRPRP